MRLVFVCAVVCGLLAAMPAASNAATASFSPPLTIGQSLAGDGPSVIATNVAGAMSQAWITDPGTCVDAACPAVALVLRSADGRTSRRFAIGGFGVTSVPGLFVDRSGVTTLVYMRDGSGVVVVRCGLGGCGAERVLDRTGTLAGAAMDGAGRVLVAWRGSTPRGPRVKTSFGAHGRFSRPRALGVSGGQVVVAASGHRFLVLWTAPGAIRGAVLAGRSIAVRPRTLLRTSSRPGIPVDPRLVGTARGFLAAWHTATETDGVQTVDVDFHGRRTGEDFIEMTRGRLMLSAAPSGRAMLTTLDYRCGGQGPAVSLREPSGRAFSSPAERLAGSPSRCPYSSVVDDAGRATIAWVRDGVAVAAFAGDHGGFGGAAPIEARPCAAVPSVYGCGDEPPLLSAAGGRTLVVWPSGAALRLAVRRDAP